MGNGQSGRKEVLHEHMTNQLIASKIYMYLCIVHAIEPSECQVVENIGITTIDESVLDGIRIKTSKAKIVIRQFICFQLFFSRYYSMQELKGELS